jgi:hypothetical protein
VAANVGIADDEAGVGLLDGLRRRLTLNSSEPPATKSAPMVLGLARDSGCLRVFDFHPMIGSARAIRRAELLRHDALAAERAGVLEDCRAVASMVLVERDTFMGVTQKLRQYSLALLDRHVPQVLAVHFEQVESAEHGGGVVPVPTDQVEDREPILVADDGLTVDQARAHWQHRHRRDDLREAVRKVGALSREQPHPTVGALGHDAEAVMLDFVNPFRTGGWAVRWTGEAGLDEVSRMGQGTFAHAICSTGIRRGAPRGWCDPGHRNRGLS